jgi:hypothetical protein
VVPAVETWYDNPVPELIVDTHAHLYPSYDLRGALESATGRLLSFKRSPDDRLAICLTERFDCHVFTELRDGAHRAAIGEIVVTPTTEPNRLLLRFDGGVELSVIGGRQIVTADRIEVLAIGHPEPIPDRLPSTETIDRVLSGGGLPVLCWAPGKWGFSRGRVIADLFSRYEGRIAAGLSTLLASGAPEPRIVREVRGRGVPVLFGSDPLPLVGEERYLASYATRVSNELPADRLSAAFVELARTAELRAEPVGQRCSSYRALSRVLRVMAAAKLGKR